MAREGKQVEISAIRQDLQKINEEKQSLEPKFLTTQANIRSLQRELRQLEEQ